LERKALLRRGLGELAIVVLGVLIALWADGLRQDRADRDAEVEYLESLGDDFSISLTQLDSVLAEHRDQIGSLESLLSEDLAAQPADSLRRWVRQGLWSIVEWSPQVSTLRDLQASGDLRVLQDNTLRRALAELDRTLGLGAVEHADFTAVQHQLIDPFLAQALDVPELFSPSGAQGAADALMVVMRSQQARNLIAYKLEMAPYDLAQRERTQEQLRLLIELVGRRLAALGVEAG
jgi:hypothetical protein